MKIALITDLHLDYRKAEDKYYNFFFKFYKNVFFPYIEENNITTIFDLGDTFDHRKTLDIQGVLKIKRDFFDYIHSKGYDFHMLVGNHDIYYRHSNVVNTPKSLLTHYDNVTVYEEIQDIDIDGLKVTMCPWINNENKDSTFDHIKSTDATVLFGHLELNNFELHTNLYMSGSEFNAEQFNTYKMVLSGHYHHRSSRYNVTYLGNPYQMTWSDYGDIRGFHILDTDTLELKFIENPYTLYEKIYYNDTNSDYSGFDYSQYKDKIIKIIVENKENGKGHFENFLQRLENVSPHEVKIVDKLEEIEISKTNTETDILTDLYNYVTVNNESINKSKLNTALTSIYQESVY